MLRRSFEPYMAQVFDAIDSLQKEALREVSIDLVDEVYDVSMVFEVRF